MAHPHLKSARDSHNAKLHRMTSEYQQGVSKNPTGNIPGPTNMMEGPMEHVGFGAESSRPNPGRTSRGVMAGIPNRARGGRTKHKGTHVNVIVAPQAPAATGAPPLGGNPATAGAGLAPSPMPRPLPPAPPPAPMGAGPAGLGGPPPMPMPMRAKGGKVMHSDEKQDKVLINKVLKEKGLAKAKGGATCKADGGKVAVPLPRPRPAGQEVQPKDLYDAEGLKRAEANRARGGKVYDAGAMSGEGRLEKVKNYGKKAHAAPQAV